MGILEQHQQYFGDAEMNGKTIAIGIVGILYAGIILWVVMR